MEMKTKKSQRIFYYDFLRSIAITSVIMCHSLALDPFSPLGGGRLMLFPLDTFGYIGVPIFFMLSGALLLNRGDSLKNFFKKRFTRIVYPYIFWFIIIAFLGLLLFDFKLEKIIAIGRGDAFTWFIWTLIGLYLFIPIIDPFIKKYSVKGISYYLVIWFFTILLNTIGKYPIKNFELSYFAGYLGFLLLGYYLTNKKFSFDKKRIILISFLIFAITFIIHSELRLMGMSLLTSSGYLNIFPVLESISLFMLIKNIDELYDSNNKSAISEVINKIKNNILGKFIYSISICSYAMYFTHIIAINLINTFTDYKISLFYLISVLIIAYLIALISSKIPILNKYSGVK